MDLISTDNGDSETAHFALATRFVVFFFIARFLLDRYVFRKLSIWLLRNGAAPLKMDAATKSKIAKCSESMWKLMYYATVELCMLVVAFREPWFIDITQYFNGWPKQELKSSIAFIYMCQFGFYLYSIVALLKWETRRKDFNVLMAHHVITAILIGYSFNFRFFRIGSVILALHDASDVLLEAAKILKYSGNEVGASVVFGLFAISWLILRLIVFPFWIIRSSCYYILEIVDLSETYDRFFYFGFNSLLLFLLSFHVYWWILICQIIGRQLKNRGRVSEDIRSESEDDD